MFAKKIEMDRTTCFDYKQGWKKDTEKHIVYRVSRWISVKQAYNVSKRNSLYDYCTDKNGYHPYDNNFDAKNGTFLDFFRWNGRNYAIEQFLAFGTMFTPETYSYTDENGKTCFLSGYDSSDYYSPIFVEFDEYCERVRVYIEQ